MPLQVAILLGPQSSLALAMLCRTVFQFANRQLRTDRYQVDLIGAGRKSTLTTDGVSVRLQASRKLYDYTLVTPYDRIAENWQPDPGEVALLQGQSRQGGIVASACLGALSLAAAGLLDGQDATTHWSWDGRVRARFPQVRWNTRRMLCDQGKVITAGGYLAVVDLALHIIAQSSSRETAHAIGQRMLADSARQHQSIYAQQLVDPGLERGQMKQLATWIEGRLRSAPSVSEMASHCHMSLRSFHRRFVETYGVTPRKFIQLKRIEAARKQLVASARSLEEILEDLGVADTTSFRRVFQRETGYSPAEYRRRLGMQRGRRL
jgi:transcriptional regulator GlxA family with amidase domain